MQVENSVAFRGDFHFLVCVFRLEAKAGVVIVRTIDRDIVFVTVVYDRIRYEIANPAVFHV